MSNNRQRIRKPCLSAWILSLAVFFLNPARSDCAEVRDKVELLGDVANVPFDQVKAIYIADTVKALLDSCTVATPVASIPPASYKGVRVTQTDGKLIQAHIFPHSVQTYTVEIFTQEKGVTRSHSKYRTNAYQLISMLELTRKGK